MSEPTVAPLSKTATEVELRAAPTPWPKTKGELIAYIDALTERKHEYGTCPYAMSLAALATFNYVSHKLGVTGFQATCADLHFIGRSRGIEGPFMLINAEDALYPQFSVYDKCKELMEKSEDWLKGEATKKLAENPDAHPDVIRHWARLAGQGNRHDERAKFLEGRNKWTDDYVQKHAAEFKKFGIHSVYLMGNPGDPAKADSVANGASFRRNMPVSLYFSRNIDGITVEWSEDTERDGSNGAPRYRFDWEKLQRLHDATTGKIQKFIAGYIKKAKRASGA